MTIAENNGFNIIGGGNVGHISFNSSEESVEKMFLDFYLLSRSSKVYIARANELYTTVFSMYASIVGDCDYEWIDV